MGEDAFLLLLLKKKSKPLNHLYAQSLSCLHSRLLGTPAINHEGYNV